MVKAGCWLFLWNFKEKSINRFLWHSQKDMPRHENEVADVSWKRKTLQCPVGIGQEAFFKYPGAAHRVERLCSGKAALESSKYGRWRREAL